MLPSYPHLRRQLMDKNRGRKNEVTISSRPDLWAHMPLGFDRDIQIYLDSSKQTVCTIRPDNSMTIDVGGWHTQLSCKIIDRLTSNQTWCFKGSLWHKGFPVDDTVEYDCARHFIEPRKYVKINDEAFARLVLVYVDDLPAKYRLMRELGTWDPAATITAKVLDYARGKIEKDQLGARDILTITKGIQPIIIRLFEEAI